MFKPGLMTSTAMTAVALLLSGASAGSCAQTGMHAASRDPNTRFLCTYGLSVSAFFSNLNSYSGYYSTWTRVAVPVIGQGQRVRRIRVVGKQGPSTSNSSLSVGIYSNTASGYPGKLIAGGTGTVGPMCGPVNISITPTKLKRHTTYWIEEKASAPRCRYTCSSFVQLYWEGGPNTKLKAYVQTHLLRGDSGTASSSFTSPWREAGYGPYMTLR